MPLPNEVITEDDANLTIKDWLLQDPEPSCREFAEIIEIVSPYHGDIDQLTFQRINLIMLKLNGLLGCYLEDLAEIRR